jgi:hypothetical protein
MPQPLYLQGKSPGYPLDRRLGRPQSCYTKVILKSTMFLTAFELTKEIHMKICDLFV